MIVYKLNPLTDRRWPEFVSGHPDASIFHTRPWLEALKETYGFVPVAYTTSAGTELSNGVVFCEVNSWLTGKRLVSVPFSDHCQPLAKGKDLQQILEYLQANRHAELWRYIELRPAMAENIEAPDRAFVACKSFGFHTIDLRRDVEAIYRGFHDSCIRRKIKRAEKEKLTYEAGNSEKILRQFRQLLILTRRRHKLPPQPASWFRNLARFLGDSLTIHIVSKDGVPVASILTLTHKRTLVYKYGCSDARYHAIGGTPLLFWKAVQIGKEIGAEEFDLGRSGYDDAGLIAFKEHLGGITSQLTYYRNTAPKLKVHSNYVQMEWARTAVAKLPTSLLTGVGELLYKHIG